MLPFYMGLDAGCHNAVTAHLLATNGIEGVIGYRCHIYVEDYFGKWCFSCDSYFDAYLCSVKEPLYWKTATREGCRQYISDSKKCALCPMWEQCFSSKATRKKVIWHVWQDALDDITIFSKTTLGKRIYRWRKETIERSFALGPSFSFVSTSSYLKGRASTFGNTAFVDVVRAAIRRRATLSDIFCGSITRNSALPFLQKMINRVWGRLPQQAASDGMSAQMLVYRLPEMTLLGYVRIMNLFFHIMRDTQ